MKSELKPARKSPASLHYLHSDVSGSQSNTVPLKAPPTTGAPTAVDRGKLRLLPTFVYTCNVKACGGGLGTRLR